MRNSVSNSVFKNDPLNCRKCLTGIIITASLTLACCISCGSLPKNNIPAGSMNRPVSWFEADTGHFLFNSSIDVIKNHFSGLTVIKPTGRGNYRVIMMSETGLKILDMEFFPDSVPYVHYIMEPMDKKILINMLGKDMSMILLNHVQDLKPVWYENFIINPGKTALYKINTRKYYYILEPGQIHPSVALLGKGRKFKVEVNFFGNMESGIDSLKLSHKNIDLSIRLTRIHELP